MADVDEFTSANPNSFAVEKYADLVQLMDQFLFPLTAKYSPRFTANFADMHLSLRKMRKSDPLLLLVDLNSGLIRTPLPSENIQLLEEIGLSRILNSHVTEERMKILVLNEEDHAGQNSSIASFSQKADSNSNHPTNSQSQLEVSLAEGVYEGDLGQFFEVIYLKFDSDGKLVSFKFGPMGTTVLEEFFCNGKICLSRTREAKIVDSTTLLVRHAFHPSWEKMRFVHSPLEI
jgi:hypothetical protein